jgi:hypothetical protein
VAALAQDSSLDIWDKSSWHHLCETACGIKFYAGKECFVIEGPFCGVKYQGMDNKNISKRLQMHTGCVTVVAGGAISVADQLKIGKHYMMLLMDQSLFAPWSKLKPTERTLLWSSWRLIC